MNRFERVKNMSIKEMAGKIIDLVETDAYCKNTCSEEDLEIDGCTAEKELACCIAWMQEE